MQLNYISVPEANSDTRNARSKEIIMSQDIVIVREPEGYRVLHGHLHLATEMMLHKEVVVDVRDEGKIKIVQTGQGYIAGRDGQHLPVLRT